MEYQIYKYLFSAFIFAVYLVIAYPLIWLSWHYFPLPGGFTTIFLIGLYFLSIFQAKQAVDIYFATEMKFWRALYLSFYEFWGLIFLQLKGSKKEQPDKLYTAS